ncbi:MAG TPA: L-threonylcarbamoyladenylate synthase [Bacilli bacterium]|nr:MAG: Threonylcarbamoyl-AMP synthase [Tenericutes bacterium ADurb.BinA124]HNZ49953.1 L-threonylcarbamoyladenylate synthase [Bacilli bacterium]HOH18270.1 L-threonylcarbamoyladenylate synthase [Bacilli bacterium]HPN60966.1 L-threonylcarbamoyladenylate synthase [Bacilli bacterium]HPX83712.1 L-threonylcarbamoyladenylate synthase [Bacilli bacterium]
MEKISLKDLLKLSKDDLQGKIICFPTDTVYGVGALYNDEVAIKKIYAMKKRDVGKPLVNLCSSIDQITDLGIVIDAQAQSLMNKHWPGALTIVLCHQEKTIAFRMPDSPIARALVDRFSLLATTSVNESKQAELNSLREIENQFFNDIDYLVTDAMSFSQIPSTVVKVCAGKISVLRQGQIDVFK